MPLGHFNVLKGAYPSLAQIDVTRPANAAATGIVRGSALIINASDEWILSEGTSATVGAANTPGPIIHFALQDFAQPDVTFAEGLTALPCRFPCEVETDQFDSAGTYALGTYLTGGTGGEVTDHNDDETACGIVTRVPYARWANDAVAVAGSRTGNRINVISFWTIYAPNLSTA